MRIGKLDNSLLKKIVIDNIHFRRPEVKVRPGIGEDCAVIGFGAYDCVLSTDPITATSERIGALAVNVSCNDIASNGVAPLGLLLSVLLPPETTDREIEEIMKGAAEAAEKLNVEIIGGHTEITAAVNQPVITATAIGRSEAKSSDAISAVSPCDRLIVTKSLGMEGTGIIAAEHADELASILTQDELRQSREMIDSISVVEDGLIAAHAGATAMHDITEGGVLGAIWELCELYGVGAIIEESKLPVADVTRKVCAHFKVNPLKLISSGSMLIAASERKAQSIIDALAEAGLTAVDIGCVVGKDEGVSILNEQGRRAEIEPPESDEIYRV